MKAIIFLVLVVLASASTVEEIQPFASISDTVTQAIEDIRDQMPCGFPSMGIPPMAPLSIKHQEISRQSSLLNVTGAIDDFVLSGLNDFTVDVMKISLFSEKAIFRFTFKNINVDTLYKLDMSLFKNGVTLVVQGDGRSRFAIKDFVIDGVAKFSFSFITQKLKLKKFETHLKIGDVQSNIQGILGQGDINTKMNALLEDVVRLSINENDEFISNTIEHTVMPVVNGVLADKKIGDLVGGGGSGEKVPCVPAK